MGVLLVVFAVAELANGAWWLSYYGKTWLFSIGNGNVEIVTDFSPAVSLWHFEAIPADHGGGLLPRLWASLTLPAWYERYTAGYIVIPFWSIAAAVAVLMVVHELTSQIRSRRIAMPEDFASGFKIPGAATFRSARLN